MSDEMTGTNDKLASYEGTRWEVMAFLDSYFSIQRRLVEGVMGDMLTVDGLLAEEDRKIEYESMAEMLDALDRSVYRVSVVPLGMMAKSVTRPENEYRAMRIRTGLELFDLARSAAKYAYEDKANS